MITTIKTSFAQNKRAYLLWGIILLFFIIYGVQAFLNHYFFRTNALDYGFHLQSMYRFMHFKSGPLTVFGKVLESYFQIHPSFTLLFLTPINWLLKPLFGSYTLLLVQNIFLILGGYYTYKVILLKSNNYSLSFLSLIHYFVLWGHFSAIAFEYIDATIASTLVPVFFYYFFKEKYLASILVLFFIISSRENMPLWFVFIGMFLGFDNVLNKKSLKWPLRISIISLLYLILIFTVLIPGFQQEGYSYNRFQYSSLGANIPEALLFVLKHPIEAIKLLFVNHLENPVYNNVKAEFWYVFLLSGGVILIKKPHYLLLFVPIIAQKMFSNDYQMWGINIFYSIEVVSILSIAAFLILKDIHNSKIRFFAGAMLCLVTFSVTVIKMNARESKWYNKGKEKIYDKNFYSSQHDIKSIQLVLDQIPKNAKVCASEKLVAHLAFRDHIYYFPNIRDAEYLILLFNSTTYPLNKTEFDTKISELTNSSEWEIMNKTKDLLLMKRVEKK
jgi:uncharacterized membrane protein